MPRSARYLAVCLFLVFILSPAHAAKNKFKARFGGSLLAEHTDNLFRLSEDDMNSFDSDHGVGERFFGMDETSDLVMRLRIKGDLSWRVAKGRSFDIDLQASHYAHVENDVSDFSRFDVEFGYDITKKDRVYAGIDQIADRFWKNYSVSGGGTFAPAVYDQSVVRIGYEREIGKHWDAGAEVRNQNRDYDAPLSNRDREGDYVAVHTTYRIVKRVKGRTLLQFGDIEVVLDTTGVPPVDRSFDESRIEQEFFVNLRKKQELEFLVQYRVRDFTTPFAADLGRFGREDRRVRVEATYGKELTKKLTLRVRAGYTDNNSDRSDPTVPTDEVGYDETTAGVGLGYKF